MSNLNNIKTELEEAQSVLTAFLSDEIQLKNVDNASALMIQSLQSGNKVISCGNGGSMCDAMHFAEELNGRFRDNRKGFAATAISDASFITCAANDFGYDHVFERFIEANGKEGDVLLAISTSGNSKNVLLAAQKAKANGIKVIALSGKDGGELASNCDVEIRAPQSKYADRAQEIHIKVIHALIKSIEDNLV
ncbi:MAG: D-sedoheptulose 7-phosphate isomerase [Bacteroidia bacterium]|nr:D-sedoheptulose 7-phosphate isomerase [Bacteroidia bacterium]